MNNKNSITYKFENDLMAIQFDVETYLGAKHRTTIVLYKSQGGDCYIKSDYKILELLLDNINDHGKIEDKVIEDNNELGATYLRGFIPKLRMINASINEYLRE